jgi:Na+/H+ antiporter NhaD/arsenite permease-like protein
VNARHKAGHDGLMLGNDRMIRRIAILAATIALLPSAAYAADLDGAQMGWPWALPFAGILLSIATGPLLFAKFWHAHYGKIAALWALLTLAPIAIVFGTAGAFAAFVHAVLGEYMSFIVLLFALYVVAGGILITGTLRGTPWVNAGILVLGTAMASIVSTTGAAMILVR